MCPMPDNGLRKKNDQGSVARGMVQLTLHNLSNSSSLHDGEPLASLLDSLLDMS